MEDQPTGNYESYEALFVFAKGIKKKEEFSIEKNCWLWVWGSWRNSCDVGNKAPSWKIPYSGRVARIYIGLKDEEALWLGAIHKHTGSFRHQLTYRDYVRNSRQGSKLLSCNDEIQCC